MVRTEYAWVVRELGDGNGCLKYAHVAGIRTQSNASL